MGQTPPKIATESSRILRDKRFSKGAKSVAGFSLQNTKSHDDKKKSPPKKKGK